METSLLANSAENYISSSLAKYQLLVTKPLFDRQGIDLLVIGEIDSEVKLGFIQCKGRTIGLNRGNSVEVSVGYVKKNFVLFLYLLPVDREEFLCCFFHDDIVKWPRRKNEFYLSIPKGFRRNAYFLLNRFCDSKAKQLLLLLKTESANESISNFFTSANDLLEFEYQKWVRTGLLPNLETVRLMMRQAVLTSIDLSRRVFVLICFYLCEIEEPEIEDLPLIMTLINDLLCSETHRSFPIDEASIEAVHSFSLSLHEEIQDYQKYFHSEVSVRMDNRSVTGMIFVLQSELGHGIEVFLEKAVLDPLLKVTLVRTKVREVTITFNQMVAKKWGSKN